MQNTLTFPSFKRQKTDANSNFNVVIAYEDFETGKHGKKTYDFLVQHLEEECRFDNQMWKFDVLGISKLREMAAKDALMADIIIISCHGTHELPPQVKAWIDSWACGESNAIALVALLGDAGYESGCNQIRDYLAQVARRARMEFFAQPNDLAVKRFDESIALERGRKRDEKTLSALAGVIQREPSFPRWGINE